MTAIQSFPTVLEGTPEELSTLVNELPKHRYRVEIRELIDPETEVDFLVQAIERRKNRAPEEIAAVRADVMAGVRKGTELPAGMTLSDMVVGKWPGDESDEQIRVALEELS